MMNEYIVKHLELIQSVITRMSTNSFLVKGWTVTLAAVLIALASDEFRTVFVTGALLPTLVFWGLDAYYLRKERVFRQLYEDVRRSAIGTGTQDVQVEAFTMSTCKYETGEFRKWFMTLWSPSVVAIPGVVVVLIICLVVFSSRY